MACRGLGHRGVVCVCVSCVAHRCVVCVGVKEGKELELLEWKWQAHLHCSPNTLLLQVSLHFSGIRALHQRRGEGRVR